MGRLTRSPAVPQLLKVSEVAEMLSVDRRTVVNWIEQERVPYLRLPGGAYRLPMQGLLSSLSGTYDLAAELREQDEAVLGERQPQAALARQELEAG